MENQFKVGIDHVLVHDEKKYISEERRVLYYANMEISQIDWLKIDIMYSFIW